ncbi:unnamed protein product, partial [Iphiclides podalirius]
MGSRGAAAGGLKNSALINATRRAPTSALALMHARSTLLACTGVRVACKQKKSGPCSPRFPFTFRNWRSGVASTVSGDHYYARKLATRLCTAHTCSARQFPPVDWIMAAGNSSADDVTALPPPSAARPMQPSENDSVPTQLPGRLALHPRKCFYQPVVRARF